MGQLQIGELPDEILSLILKYAHSFNTKEVYNIISVCKHWRTLTESTFVFDVNSFFTTSRSDEEWSVARTSNRRYKSLRMNIFSENLVNLEWAYDILEITKKTLHSVNLNFGTDEEVLQVNFDYFYNLWSLLSNCTNININFINFGFYEPNKSPNRTEIEFSRLTGLDIKWRRNNNWFKFFFGSNFMEVFYDRNNDTDEVEETQETEKDSCVDNDPNEIIHTEKSNSSSEADKNNLEMKIKKSEKSTKKETKNRHEDKIQLEEIVSRTLLKYTRAPKVETIRIDVPGYHFSKSLENFMSFFNSNSKTLRSVYLWCENSYGFEWNSELLSIWYNPSMEEQLSIFLENRLETLKKLTLHWTDNKQLIGRLVSNSNLHHFETSIDLVDVYDNEVFSSVKQMTLWKFRLSREKLLKLNANFPKLEILRFKYTCITYEQRDMILEIFESLTDLQIYNNSNETFESVMNK